MWYVPGTVGAVVVQEKLPDAPRCCWFEFQSPWLRGVAPLAAAGGIQAMYSWMTHPGQKLKSVPGPTCHDPPNVIVAPGSTVAVSPLTLDSMSETWMVVFEMRMVPWSMG